MGGNRHATARAIAGRDTRRHPPGRIRRATRTRSGPVGAGAGTPPRGGRRPGGPYHPRRRVAKRISAGAASSAPLRPARRPPGRKAHARAR